MSRARRFATVVVVWPLLGIALILASSWYFRHTTPQVAPIGDHVGSDESLIREFRAKFTPVNPRATDVWVIEIRSATDARHPGAQYAALVTAWDDSSTGTPRPGEAFGLGELYGVFIVDSTMTHIVHTLGVFPTRRWHDYQVRLESVSTDSIVVTGQGVAYGDEPMGLRFDWNGNRDSAFVWTPPAARESAD